MTMTLLGTLMTMRLLEIYTNMSLMGYPTHCYEGSLMTMTLWGYPHDYEIMGDP